MKTSLNMARIRSLTAFFALACFLVGCGQENEVNQDPTSSVTSNRPAGQAPESEYPDNVVAVVDEFTITREDADKRAGMNMRKEGILESDPDFEAKLRTARKGAVDMLIESHILQQAATDTIEVSTQEVEDELFAIKQRHPTRESYEEGLRLAGFSEEEFRDVLANEIRIRKAMGTAAGRGLETPTPEDARDFYEKNPFLFEWPRRVRYDEVVWPLRPEVSDASSEEAMKAMNELADRMAANPGLFDSVLKEATSSSWGPVGIRNGYMNMEDLPTEVQDALKILNIDEPSRPVRTPLGISILSIRSTRQTYESAFQEILQSIYDARAAKNLEDWKTRLRDRHTVRIIDLDYYEGKAASDSEPADNS